ncbi:MAG: silent information regulator protein Sir2 [Verrucomicrobiia bacterium]
MKPFLLTLVTVLFLSSSLHSVAGEVQKTSARGLIALPNEKGTVAVGWRLLSSDSQDTRFHVYRRDVYGGTDFVRASTEPIADSTTFVDDTARNGLSYRYRVHALAEAGEVPSSDTAYVTSTDWHRPYLPIKLDGSHTAHSVGLGDLNGDGVLDYVIKQPDFNTDPYHRKGYWKRSPEPYQLEAYNGATGELMWRYSMGWAIETGVWYAPFIVYDIDQDGFAEVYTKAGEGDPREIDGRVISGPEYLVKIDGRTGRIVNRVDWHSREGWNEYNRSQRHMLAVAYLDGATPSLIMQRGTYDLMKTSALDKNLSRIWNREARNPHNLPGPGTHGLITADVDMDGRDELILGATALDDNGTVLWETGLGHPDACYVADIDPSHPGLEIFMGIEPRRSSHGLCLVSARDGRVLWFFDGPTRHVHSKGMIADIDPSHPGIEAYAGEQDGSQFWLYAADGTRISDRSFGTLAPLAVWWDDDLQKEVIVNKRLLKYPDQTVLELEGKVLAIADCLGDWREEIITSLPGELRIYSSTAPSGNRRTWLMDDRQVPGQVLRLDQWAITASRN